jgi:hypothetical protein
MMNRGNTYIKELISPLIFSYKLGITLPQERIRRSSVARFHHVARFSPLVFSAALKTMVTAFETPIM